MRAYFSRPRVTKPLAGMTIPGINVHLMLLAIVEFFHYVTYCQVFYDGRYHYVAVVNAGTRARKVLI